jgi:hypothetical protein
MGSFIQKFKDMFMKPDTSDQERIDRWKNEIDDTDRLKDLHLKARKQEKKAKEATKMPISAPYKREKKGLITKKGLTVEDFERAKLTKKQKNKTLSSNF